MAARKRWSTTPGRSASTPPRCTSVAARKRTRAEQCPPLRRSCSSPPIGGEAGRGGIDDCAQPPLLTSPPIGGEEFEGLSPDAGLRPAARLALLPAGAQFQAAADRDLSAQDAGPGPRLGAG